MTAEVDAPRGKGHPRVQALTQLIFDGGIECVTADYIGVDGWMLLVLLSLVQGLNGVFHVPWWHEPAAATRDGRVC